ncbi:MAG: SRPBCC family protein [Alphaproteobacteria bacterium]|nr:SRPBCC family protein [Alphaproteobacteria bacterium]
MTRFVYVTYIRATPDAVFDALTRPEFTTRYWAGTTQTSEWKAGAALGVHTPDGRLWDSGEVLEIDRPRKLVMRWLNEGFAEMKAEGPTVIAYELEAQGSVTKLTLTQTSAVENSKVIGAMSQGWPAVLAGLKSLLETGEPIAEFAKWPEGL